MKSAAIIQARMGSSRFPGKILSSVNNRPLIGLMLERLKNAQLIDDVIVATTTTPKDNELCEYLKSMGIKFFRGSENDVLRRVLEASLKYDVSQIVRLTADCPLIDPSLVDLCIKEFRLQGVDYMSSTTLSSDYPRGQDVEVFHRSSLQYLNTILPQDCSHREHVAFYMYTEQHYDYSCSSCSAPKAKIDPQIRLTVDFKEDVLLVREIVERLGEHCTLHEICQLVHENPSLLKLNSSKNITKYPNDYLRHSTNKKV